MIPPVFKILHPFFYKHMKIPAFYSDPFQIYVAAFQMLGIA